MENLYIGLLGSLLVLDTTVAFQFLVSQPLITCTIIGWFLGDVTLGLQIGMYLQLLWLSSMPVGAAIVPEGNIAAIIITTIVFRYHSNFDYYNTVLILGVLYGVLISYLGGELVVLYRKSNQYFLKKVLAFARRGNLNIFTGINFLALIFHYVLMFVLIFISLVLGDYLFKNIKLLPMEWDIYFKYGVISLIGIGAGLMLTIFRDTKFRLAIGVGLIAGCLIFVFK